MKSFKRTIIEGLSHSSASTIVGQAANILTFYLLARFSLDPDDFGVVAMVTVLVGFAALFTECGVGASLIQKQEVTEDHRSSAFWLSLLLGTLAYCLFFLARGQIAEFYEQPILRTMVAVAGLTFLLTPLSSVHLSLLRKDLRFGKVATISILADLVSSSVAVGMAFFGWGPWSLVGRALVRASTVSLACWTTTAWRPSFLFSPSALKEILSFGGPYLGTQSFAYAAQKLDEVLLGRVVGSTAIGSYNSAYRLTYTPVSLIKNQVVGVFYPALSTIQNDLGRVRSIVIRLTGILATIGFPVLFYLVACSQNWVQLLLGEKWSSMGLATSFLSGAALFETSIFPGVIYLSQGDSKGYLRLMFCTKSLNAIAMVVGVFSAGTVGLLAGLLIASMVSFFPYTYFSSKKIEMPLGDLLRANAGPFLISLLAACAAAAISFTGLTSFGLPLLIAAQSVAFVAIVVAGYVILVPPSLGEALVAARDHARQYFGSGSSTPPGQASQESSS